MTQLMPMREFERLLRIAQTRHVEVDARVVPCPNCGARKGVKCRRPSGHAAWDAHAERWDAAVLELAGATA